MNLVHVSSTFLCLCKSFTYSIINSGQVFNGSGTYQDVGIDISNTKFFAFVINNCTNLNVILGTNASNVFSDYYRFMITPTWAFG